MKKTALILYLCILNVIGHTQSQLFDDTDAFLKKYVTHGLVDYSALKKQFQDLEHIWKQYQLIDTMNVHEEKAFLINYYNISVMYLLIKHYPVSSPKEIPGFFDEKYIVYKNKKISLNELENSIIRKKYSDARIHFVLVCGAIGCPPITNFAYTPNLLEQQLNQQTSLALNREDFITRNDDDKKVFISEIFKWYEEDFLKAHKNIIQFINTYRNTPISENYSIDYYAYNWGINDLNSVLFNENNLSNNALQLKTKQKKSTQEFTPSVLYEKGQWEYKFFNNLYTQTKGFDAIGNTLNYANRGTYFSSINQVLFGLNARVNVGFDFWIKSVRIDDVGNSPFKILSFERLNNTRTALTGVGPKIKIQPFKKLSKLSIQSTLLIPTAKDMEGKFNNKPYLSQQAYTWITQVNYDYTVSSKFQLFFQVAPWVYKTTSASGTSSTSYSISTPTTLFISYFPTKKLTFYLQEEWWPNFGLGGIASWFRQEGLGLKYQVIQGVLELESSVTKFTMGKNAGAGITYNAGIRFMKL